MGPAPTTPGSVQFKATAKTPRPVASMSNHRTIGAKVIANLSKPVFENLSPRQQLTKARKAYELKMKELNERVVTQFDTNLKLRREVIPGLESELSCMFDHLGAAKAVTLKHLYETKIEMEEQLSKLRFQNEELE